MSNVTVTVGGWSHLTERLSTSAACEQRTPWCRDDNARISRGVTATCWSAMMPGRCWVTRPQARLLAARIPLDAAAARAGGGPPAPSSAAASHPEPSSPCGAETQAWPGQGEARACGCRWGYTAARWEGKQRHERMLRCVHAQQEVKERRQQLAAKQAGSGVDGAANWPDEQAVRLQHRNCRLAGSRLT